MEAKKMESEQEVIKKWLESGNFISELDAGKMAVIIGQPKLVDGKFGQKLLIEVELTDIAGKHEVKSMSLGKMIVRDIAKRLGDPTRWSGAKGKIVTIKTFNPEKQVIFDKPIFEVI
jgi:hypothetical protein